MQKIRVCDLPQDRQALLMRLAARSGARLPAELPVSYAPAALFPLVPFGAPAASAEYGARPDTQAPVLVQRGHLIDAEGGNAIAQIERLQWVGYVDVTPWTPRDVDSQLDQGMVMPLPSGEPLCKSN